jgi:hypothetical protein
MRAMMALFQITVISYEVGMTNISETTKASHLKQASRTVILASILTIILYFVPFLYPIAYPFILFSTLVHEMGHGLAAILLGGYFDSFKMWANGSGVANIAGDFGNFARAAIAAAGLMGPALMAGLFFIMVKSERRARLMLASFGILLVLSIMLVVRNLFGVFFVGLMVALCFYFSLGALKKYSQILLAFLAAQLSLSVFSRSDYLFTPVALTSEGTMPSDVAQIASALYLPYWFWGACCGIFSLLILALGIRGIFKKS